MQNNIDFRKRIIIKLVFVRITHQTINMLVLIGLGIIRINTKGNSLIMKSSPDPECRKRKR